MHSTLSPCALTDSQSILKILHPRVFGQRWGGILVQKQPMCPVPLLLFRACPVLATRRRDLDVRWLCSHALEPEQWESLGGVTLVKVNMWRGPGVNECCDPLPTPIWQQCWAEKGMHRKGVYFALTRAVIPSVQNMVLDPRGTPRYVKSPSAPSLLCEALSW